jgi:hypothetical protein
MLRFPLNGRANKSKVSGIAALIMASAFASVLGGCQSYPSCALATPAEGWRILDAPPSIEVQSWSQYLTATDNELIWVQHQNGAYGRCWRKKGDKYCSGLLEILSPNPDEGVLITGPEKCH